MKKLCLALVLIMTYNSFADITLVIEKILPSVVTVTVKEINSESISMGFVEKELSPEEVAYKRTLEMIGVYTSGSGFVINRKGTFYIITNAHVIEKAGSSSDALSVISINQNEYRVKVLGGDSFYDIAVLEFIDKPGKEILPVEFSKTEPKVAEAVYAIGNPKGDFPYTVTNGIIAGKNRVLDGLTGKYGYLQTTAAIFPGNSGGPLFNSLGQVIGINTSIHHINDVPLSQFNFALESRIAKRAVEDILTYGKVQRLYLGLIVTQNYAFIESSVIKQDKQPKVFALVPGSPAELKLKDKIGADILEINNLPVRNIEEALGAFEEATPNSNLTLKIKFNDKEETITIKSGDMSDANLEKIAHFFFNTYLEVNLEHSNGTVTLLKDRGNPIKPSVGKDFGFRKESYKKNDNLLNNNSGFTISVLGWDWDNLWGVGSIKDLAVAMRLSLINGGFQYGHNSEDIFWLSGNENIQTKTLIY